MIARQTIQKKLVDKYIKEDSRIKYFCLENNSGAAVARTKSNGVGKWGIYGFFGFG